MLTIREPIRLTAKPSMISVSDNFSARMTANYEVMASRINEEDMLHFISAPPEVYLAEGGEGSFVNMRSTFNSQNTNVELINNVVNRILVSDTYHMTYQDQVFVTSILRKIGVTDVNAFINEVKLLREETKNVNELIRLYHADGDVLHALNEYHTTGTTVQKMENAEEREQDQISLWLHQEILNRLHTADTYRQVKQYISDSMTNHSVIHAVEMQLSEQTLAEQNITLNKLRNDTVSGEQPLVYNKVNTYELGDANTMEETHQSMVQQLVQAVLVNALNQMYVMRKDELTSQKNVWYRLSEAIHESTQNTLQRFESFHNTLQVSKEESDAYHTTVQQYQKHEIDVLQQFSATQNTLLRKNQYVSNETVMEPLLHQSDEEAGLEDANPQITINQTQHTEQSIQQTQQVKHQTEQLTREEILKQQLDIINQQNIERLQKLQQVNLHTTKPEKHIVNMKKVREDALRAMENPQEILEAYQKLETNVTNQQLINREELSQIFDEDTIRILEQVQKQQTQPKSEYQRQIEMETAQGMLQRDILEQQKIEREHIVNEHDEVEKEALVYHMENVTHVSESTMTEEPASGRHELEIRQEQKEQITENVLDRLDRTVLEKLSAIDREVRTQTATVAEKLTDRYLTRTISFPKKTERQELYQESKDLTTLVQKTDTDIRHTVSDEVQALDVQDRELLVHQAQDMIEHEVQEQRNEIRSTEQSVTQNLLERTLTDERDRTVREQDVTREQELVHDLREVTQVSETEPETVQLSVMETKAPDVEHRELLLHQEQDRIRREMQEQRNEIRSTEQSVTQNLLERMLTDERDRTVREHDMTHEQELVHDLREVTQVSETEPETVQLSVTETKAPDVEHRELLLHQEQDRIRREMQEQRNEIRSTKQSVTQNILERTLTDERNRIVREHDMTHEQELVHDLREVTQLSETEPETVQLSVTEKNIQDAVDVLTQERSIVEREITRQLTSTMQEHDTFREEELVHDIREMTQLSETEPYVTRMTQTQRSRPGQEEVRLVYRESDEAAQNSPSEERDAILQSTSQKELHTVIEQLTEKQTQQTLQQRREVVTETLIHDVEKQIERVGGTSERIRQLRQGAIRNVTQVELTHKSNETFLDEEMVEELRSIGRNTKVEIEETKENVNETRTLHETVTNKVNEIELHQNEEIERLISQNVRQQLGQLSEQVYGKLEKRMDAERRRRGL